MPHAFSCQHECIEHGHDTSVLLCMSFSCTPVGSELNVIPESGTTFGYSALTTPTGTPQSGIPTLGPSPLMRALSGSGIARLNRVGSNPLSDMNRHSLQQVCSSSSDLSGAAVSLLVTCTSCRCVKAEACMKVWLQCKHQPCLQQCDASVAALPIIPKMLFCKFSF